MRKQEGWKRKSKGQNQNMKNEEGITLVALAITIVILIILAGVTINVVMGDGGLIQQAKYAKELTTNSIEKEKEEMNTLMKELEGAIQGPTEQGVEITISKTPETETSGGVRLVVEKVEGIEGNIDLNTVNIESLSEEEKKDMIRTIYVFSYNSSLDDSEKFRTFEELIEKEYGGDENRYWEEIDSYGEIDNFLQGIIEQLKSGNVQKINNYTIVNQEGEVSNEQIALANGEYTFTVTEILTGKTYTKTVQVNNIDTSMEYYFVGQYRDEVTLRDKTNIETTFENAYIIYNNNRIDIAECIEYNTYIYSFYTIDYLEKMGIIENIESLYNTVQTIEIVKEGKSYFGFIRIGYPD